MKELLDILKIRAQAPHLPYTLATVVRVTGSSYRRPGARLLVGARGRLAGSVSGGCLEKDVIARARRVLAEGQAELAVYDATDLQDESFGATLGCGGRIEILLEPVPAEKPWALARHVEEALRSGVPATLTTTFFREAGGWTVARSVHYEEPFVEGNGLALATGARGSNTNGSSTNGSSTNGSILINKDSAPQIVSEIIAPLPTLLIFGAEADVAPLVRLAREIGFIITVLDRRRDYAHPEAFPLADAILWRAPHQLEPNLFAAPASAAIIMNHHYETDRELLGRLLTLPQPLAYLGMLGPRRRTEQALTELRAAGATLPPERVTRLHAPAGLDLGAETPEQIALSILAEIVATLAHGTGLALRDRPGPIHRPVASIPARD